MKCNLIKPYSVFMPLYAERVNLFCMPDTSQIFIFKKNLKFKNNCKVKLNENLVLL